MAELALITPMALIRKKAVAEGRNTSLESFLNGSEHTDSLPPRSLEQNKLEREQISTHLLLFTLALGLSTHSRSGDCILNRFFHDRSDKLWLDGTDTFGNEFIWSCYTICTHRMNGLSNCR